MIAAFLGRWRRVLIVLCMFAAPSCGFADGAPVLTVHRAGNAEPATWSLAQLQAQPAIEYMTTTPFTEGPQRFVGVSLLAVLGSVDPNAVVSLRALNDYVVSVPAAELTADYPIIAYARNGAAMSVRDKGPLWVIYPFDQSERFQNEVTYSRSIWQLIEIRIDW
ncbi:MAG: oxidoreductase [Rhodobacteraceae bacterium]|nr:oxidoreductase [Paracoccaceae bacterium]